MEVPRGRSLSRRWPRQGATHTVPAPALACGREQLRPLPVQRSDECSDKWLLRVVLGVLDPASECFLPSPMPRATSGHMSVWQALEPGVQQA